MTQKIFSKDTLPDIKKYSTGEFAGHPNGGDLKEDLKVKCTLLEQKSTTAVVDIAISTPTGHEFDIYFHLKKDSIWKVEAFRALAMSGLTETLNMQLKALNTKQVDSVITSSHGKGKEYSFFSSREEYEFMLGNTGLTIASDKELVAHFEKNKQAFENLKNDLIKKGIMNTDHSSKMLKDASCDKQLRALFIDNAYRDRESSSKNLNFLVGGILDNTVGYLYVDDLKNLPEMSPSHFIMIRKIADGWYLYKTT